MVPLLPRMKSSLLNASIESQKNSICRADFAARNTRGVARANLGSTESPLTPLQLDSSSHGRKADYETRLAS